ncbi:hypothetical protein K466DRAFT_587505 [Polyporus arcularius HHB13444]|uniref:Uncharacterized protein n=1 Tax=Polyporus arcularius HHB13444 TaxID=1314778 RepID=A0A5C3P8T7_9APHY|nr:hypothetical protein K466DRAFT_587505 [Polyporus arcularius HHB13444]
MAVTPKPEPKESTLPPAPKLSAEEQKELEQARNGALKTLAEHRRAIAWPIGKWPVEKRVVYTRARVYLPRTYLARYGSDVRAVYPGTDLNQFIHRHYCEEVGKDGRRIEEGKDEKIAAEAKEKEKDRTPWPNYVAAEGILARRNEFLGPDPRVVGYFVDADGDYHIRWYDTFLQDQWMDNRKWKFDVRQDEHGHWVDADD